MDGLTFANAAGVPLLVTPTWGDAPTQIAAGRMSPLPPQTRASPLPRKTWSVYVAEGMRYVASVHVHRDPQGLAVKTVEPAGGPPRVVVSPREGGFTAFRP